MVPANASKGDQLSILVLTLHYFFFLSLFFFFFSFSISLNSMAWGNSSGRAVLWVTLLYGSDSTCVCDASAHVRKSCHKVISHVISDEVFTIYIFVTWISSNFTCGDDTQTYILDQTCEYEA